MIKKYLDEASIAYYSGSPIMPDAVFDRLAEASGYARIGAKQHENLGKHYYPMYSLQKYYEDEGASPLVGITDITTSPKLDGAAVSLLYIDGNLAQVLCRGDGIEGTDLTEKFIARKDLVPLKVPRLDVFQVTGEIVAIKEIPNSRNYAAGALNLKDIAEFKTRAISFYAYGVYPPQGTTFVRDMVLLITQGFQTIIAKELHNIYPCDGVVFRVNNNATFESMGYTAKHPRGAYAKKDRQTAVETTILSVEWGVGKSGKVTPVAILEPIYIGDKLVSRATLNNPGFIEMLNICIGDRVGVVLNGEIIPGITHKVEA